MRWLILLLAPLMGLATATALPAQVAEICDNDIDDDGDGLVDCDDDDCSFPLFSNYALGDSNSRIVSLGDLDGDGDLDAWVANSVNQANRVWINQGGVQGGVAGNFLDSGQALGNSRSTSVALGDLDADGDLDAWVANWQNRANRVWINDGLGNFADSGQGIGSSVSTDVSLGDLDGDGDLDAWVANYGLQPNRVYMNLSSCSPDLDGDGIPNACDIDQTQGEDCDGNGIADICDEDLNSDGIPDACQDPFFRRGDANGDGGMNLTDAVHSLGYLYGTTVIDCFDAADTNDDGTVNLSDPIYLLGYLFNAGPDPLAPFPSCDLDPTDDFLGCENYDGC
jgi:hypothetical protein